MAMKNALNAGYSLFALCACLALGKLLNHYVNGLPASLYGLIIFTSLLQFGAINPHRLQHTIEWVIRNMGVCFVPAGVGIIEHFELIKVHGIAMVAITFITTFALLTFVGLSYQKHINRQQDKKANIKSSNE